MNALAEWAAEERERERLALEIYRTEEAFRRQLRRISAADRLEPYRAPEWCVPLAAPNERLPVQRPV